MTEKDIAQKEDIHIVIAGAGLGGLCLAQSLKKQGISFAVYEKDEAADSRTQGYRLRIDETGQRALAACLPVDLNRLFRQTCAVSTSQGRFLDPRLQPINGRPAESWRPSVIASPDQAEDAGGDRSANRLTLREILLTGIEDNVHFGKAVERFEQRGSGLVTVAFEDGETTEADLLVAADGVNSAIARHRFPLSAPKDTGTACIYGKTRPAPGSAVDDLLLSGTSVIFTDEFAVILDAMCFRFPAEAAQLTPVEDYVYWAFIGRRTRLGVSDETLPSGTALMRAIERLAKGWSPGLRAVFAEADAQTVTALPIRSAAPLHAWTATRVTALGDAIHAMSPAGGVGANSALRDAETLGGAIAEAVTARSPLPEAVARYEEDMRRHANRAIDISAESARRLLHETTFTIHDVSDFPVVLSLPDAVVPGYAERWEGEMAALLGRQRPFVIIFPASRTEETHEDRKRRGIWLKANKEALGRLCLSLIIVERDGQKREEMKAQTPMATKAFGIPMEIVASFEEAWSAAAWLTRADQRPASARSPT
jgi:2-polyprenyl-6-methoxyphenol hydroxylase-like FAD-dependent oxidoreductase